MSSSSRSVRTQSFRLFPASCLPPSFSFSLFFFISFLLHFVPFFSFLPKSGRVTLKFVRIPHREPCQINNNDSKIIKRKITSTVSAFTQTNMQEHNRERPWKAPVLYFQRLSHMGEGEGSRLLICGGPSQVRLSFCR